MSDIKNTARKLRAEGVNAKWYSAWNKNFPKRELTQKEVQANLIRNERWIRKKIAEGYKIYDIGLDNSRRIRSKYYQLEKKILQETNTPVIEIPRAGN